MTGDANVPVTYSIVQHGAGWRVYSRGFVWDFSQGAQAVDFANDMAEQFARALGLPTRVCFRDEAGEFHELHDFEIPPAWLSPPPHARQGTVVPFRPKA